jgi:opacity protein-like surface antigen
MEPKVWMYVAGAGVRYKVEKNLFVKLEHNFCWRAKYRVQAIKLGVGWVI